MKQEIIKIKVLEGAPELKGKILELVRTDEMLYRCINSNIEIFDGWEELDSIEEYSKKSDDNIFFDMHIFSTSYGNDLKFIDEVKYLGSRTMFTEVLERMGIEFKEIEVKCYEEGECPF